MGKKENLYTREFIEYYLDLGVDHILIYDNNDPFTEKIEDIIDLQYKDKITLFDTKQLNINNQPEVFTNCYKNNYKIYDWFIMVDMDEYLYIVKDTLKNYLTKHVFDKCDFIKINWANALDNNLLHYDSRPLFIRFPKPYLKSRFIKSIIRGNITNLKYWVHSPIISPNRNVTCNNEGKRIHYKKMNFESIEPPNIKKAYLIHFKYKSTEEYIKKYKRGYRDWLGNRTKEFMKISLQEYFEDNEINMEKINYIKKELNINLSEYRDIYKKINHSNKTFIKTFNLFFFLLSFI